MGMADEYTTEDILRRMRPGGFPDTGRLAIDPTRLWSGLQGLAQGFVQPAANVLNQGPRMLSSGGYDPGEDAFNLARAPFSAGSAFAQTGSLGSGGGRRCRQAEPELGARCQGRRRVSRRVEVTGRTGARGRLATGAGEPEPAQPLPGDAARSERHRAHPARRHRAVAVPEPAEEPQG